MNRLMNATVPMRRTESGCSARHFASMRKKIRLPYEKHHSTALDAGRTAQELGIQNLILYHTEDSDLKHRKDRYTKEAGRFF